MAIGVSVQYNCKSTFKSKLSKFVPKMTKNFKLNCFQAYEKIAVIL